MLFGVECFGKYPERLWPIGVWKMQSISVHFWNSQKLILNSFGQ
jgi:hypothetical protein